MVLVVSTRHCHITARKKLPASQHAGNAFAMPNATPWSVEEDVRLCKAYTNISEDGATSTDQNATAFWDRIHATYSQLGATDTVEDTCMVHPSPRDMEMRC
ncbi:hypothetical protein PF008_g25338 [Phytophthora fragariae]|uniref:Myb-like domain-containing protein n=1 Tax=Phytophthora fragariae TaxID=53985 RepID=A0A6G0QL64_9STRA|nr:hypothetical protein PF008_g25338 [Phytophthora fragariae]